MPEVIGRSVPRADGPGKVTGQTLYTADIEHKGMLHAAILRSPVPAGKIVRLNVDKARQMPGVKAVVTAADVPDIRAGWALFDTPMFARDEVLFEGEPIAAVAATTLAQSRAAVAAIELEIQEIPPVGDIDMALAAGARLIHPKLAQYGSVPGIVFNREGNVACKYAYEEPGVDDAFAKADRIIEDTYDFGRQYQGYLEPKGTIVQYRDGRYTVQSGHQYVFNLRDRLAQFLQIKPSDVRVQGMAIGGGFGGKLDFGPEPYAAVLAKATGKPVKLIFSREEDLLAATVREGARVRVRSALDKDGNIIGREFFTDHDNGAYSGELILMAGLALMFCRGVYRTGPIRTQFRLIYTNTSPTGAYRGVSGVPMISAIECHMDHIARELGVDPRAYRLTHTLENNEKLPNGQMLHDAAILREAYAEIEKIAPWEEMKRTKKPLEGVAIGSTVWLTNPLPASATVKLNEDGSAYVLSGTCDIGTGAMAQGVVGIVAQTLGLDPANVHIVQPDTDVAAYDGGSQGSRTTRAVGRAAEHAAIEVRQKVLDAAAPLMQTEAARLTLSGGKIHDIEDPGKAIGLADILMMGAFASGPIVGTGKHAEQPIPFDPGCAAGLAFPTLPTPTYHVHMAKVAVCPMTGNVEVKRYIVAQEVGKALNPQGISGQIQGGVCQGIGYALHEGLRVKDGRYMERSLEAYRLPLAVDIPEVEAIILEHPADEGPFGAKGTAEPPIVLAPAVIHNAIYDAIGVPLNSIPLTPENILEALERRKSA